MKNLFLLLTLLLPLISKADVSTVKNVKPVAATNPLLAEWKGPYGGVPPFDKVRVSDFKPALETAMQENLKEIDAIANNTDTPNFENTILAMEKTGADYIRVKSIYDVWSSSMNTGEFQAVQTEMDPKIAAFTDKIIQNEKLFQRIESIYNSPEKSQLTPPQQRLIWYYYTNFERNGARLDEAAKAKLLDINQQLAKLSATFSQNLLADEAGHILYLQEKDLTGLPQSIRDAAAATADAKGHKGEYAILNTRSSMDPFLTYSDRRDLREKVWRTYYSRGDNGDAHDNNQIITQILQLRAEKAKLLGFPTFAHLRLANQMAKTPENALHLMTEIWPAAVSRVHEEVADMQAIADKEGAGIKIEPWDYRYYSEKVRKAKYDLDQNDVKPHLQLDKMREAVFWVAGQLYGFQFKEIHNIPTITPDVRVWEVSDANGKHVGVWYFDPYARPGKNSGAWMSEYRTQQGLENISPIVSNNANFVKVKAGEPVLISWDDAVTLFHEFGHALHGLNSHVTYPSLAGTNVPTDYVEFPSALNENWLPTPEVLSKFALHYKTGKPIPQELVDKLEKSKYFNQGFKTTEYLASALVDMKLHLAGAAKIDPDAFEKESLAELGMPHEMVMRHRTPQFSHIFSSEQYAAGYYSYLWSEVIDRDAFEAFLEAGGPYDKAIAKKLQEKIMSVGNSIDPADAYREFRGRDPKIDAYLRAHGFPTDSKSATGQ
jgi:peptidyl-dipeptidase Dcp